jgi:YggT family protein
MFVAHNFILAVARLIDFLLTAYMWVIIGRAVVSWVNADPYNPVVRFLYEATEPVLSWIRRILPISVGGIDFSPVIVIAGIYFLQSFLVPTLMHLGM